MAFFYPAQAGPGVFEFFEVHLYEKNLHFRLKIVLSSDKTPPSDKITLNSTGPITLANTFLTDFKTFFHSFSYF